MQAETSTPFSCSRCPNTFKNEVGLKIHGIKTHKDAPQGKEKEKKNKPQSTEREKKNKCDQCDHAYSSRESLRDHVNWKHKGLKLHECILCGAKFGWGGDFRQHVRDHKLFDKEERSNEESSSGSEIFTRGNTSISTQSTSTEPAKTLLRCSDANKLVKNSNEKSDQNDFQGIDLDHGNGALSCTITNRKGVKDSADVNSVQQTIRRNQNSTMMNESSPEAPNANTVAQHQSKNQRSALRYKASSSNVSPVNSMQHSMDRKRSKVMNNETRSKANNENNSATADMLDISTPDEIVTEGTRSNATFQNQDTEENAKRRIQLHNTTDVADNVNLCSRSRHQQIGAENIKTMNDSRSSEESIVNSTQPSRKHRNIMMNDNRSEAKSANESAAAANVNQISTRDDFGRVRGSNSDFHGQDTEEDVKPFRKRDHPSQPEPILTEREQLSNKMEFVLNELRNLEQAEIQFTDRKDQVVAERRSLEREEEQLEMQLEIARIEKDQMELEMRKLRRILAEVERREIKRERMEE